MRRFFSLSGCLLLVGSISVGLHAQQHGASVKVSIASGPNAGSYTVEGQQPCEIDPSTAKQPRTLKAAVGDPAKVANHRVVGNALFEISLSGAGPLTAIDIDIIFGEPDNVAADYYVTTLPANEQQGSGIATFKEHGSSATLTFQAQTAKGVRFEGTLECYAIRKP